MGTYCKIHIALRDTLSQCQIEDHPHVEISGTTGAESMVAAAADRLPAATTAGVTTMTAVAATAEETMTTEDQPEMFHHPEVVALEITAESVDVVEAGVP